MRSKLSLRVILGLLTIPTIARADSLSLGQIAQELKQDAAIPLAPSVGNQLAKNLLAAQAAAPYTQFEPDSLQLSIDAVLRAIGLYAFPGGPTEIVNEQLTPIPFLQSRIAIDDRLTVTLTPGSLDFGSQPVATPEPAEWLGLLFGFALLATCQMMTGNTRLRRLLLIGNSLFASTTLTAQEQSSKTGTPVEIVATASEYVPRTTTISHPGHAYTDCHGSTSYLGDFHFSGFEDSGTISGRGEISGTANTDTHCKTTFSPPRETTFASYRKVSYTIAKSGESLYLLACTAHWKPSAGTRFRAMIAAGTKEAEETHTSQKRAQEIYSTGSGHWSDCPAFGIGAQYTLRIQSASDARLDDSSGGKPNKLEYLGSVFTSALKTPSVGAPAATATKVQSIHSPNGETEGTMKAAGQDPGKDQALSQMRQIVDAIRQCPPESPHSFPENGALINFTRALVLEWDLISSDSLRSPFQGFVRFRIEGELQESDEAKKSAKFGAEYREFAESMRNCEEKYHGSCLNREYRYDFDLGTDKPELRKAIFSLATQKEPTVYEPQATPCTDGIAKAPGAVATKRSIDRR